MNILIIKFASIGDVIHATPAFHAIRIQFPEAHITLMVGEWSRPVVEGNRNIDQIESFSDRDFFGMQPLGVWHAWEKLRHTEWDIIVVMQRAFPWVLLARLLPAKQRVGFDRGWNRFLLTSIAYEERRSHHIHRYLELAKQLGATPQGLDTEFHLTAKEHQFADTFWRERGLDSFPTVIAIPPGGAVNPKETKMIKRYPLPSYRRVAQEFLRDPHVALVAVGSASDHRVGEELCASFRGQAVNLCGKTSLLQLGAVFTRCQLLISHDTGPLHIAAAVGLRTLSLFGPTLPSAHAPLGSIHRVIQSPLAVGLVQTDDTEYLRVSSDVDLMQAISPQEVVRVGREMLGHR